MGGETPERILFGAVIAVKHAIAHYGLIVLVPGCFGKVLASGRPVAEPQVGRINELR
jgi:hypothetical protein